MSTRLVQQKHAFGGRGVGGVAGAVAVAAIAAVLAVAPASAAVMFAAGAGTSLTITGIDGDAGALSAARVFATEARTRADAVAGGAAGDHRFDDTRSFEVAPESFGTAEATASAVALSRSVDPASPTAEDPFTGSGLFQLTEIEGTAAVLGTGFAGASAEATAFGSYEIVNDWHAPIRVHFDYELGLAALARVDDPELEVANAKASVEIRRSDADGLVFADVVGAGEDGLASGSFFLDVPGFGSSTVIAVAEALGEAAVVPLPAGAWLLIPGLGVLSWAWRRRRDGTPVASAAG
jgi:hypothetical protein